MPAVARVGDKAQIPADSHGCPACPHPATGPGVSGSPDTEVNGKPVLRLGDPGIHAACCQANTWTAKEGSSTVFVNDKPIHREGDHTQHCGGIGVMTEGSPDVDAGGSPSSGEDGGSDDKDGDKGDGDGSGSQDGGDGGDGDKGGGDGGDGDKGDGDGGEGDKGGGNLAEAPKEAVKSFGESLRGLNSVEDAGIDAAKGFVEKLVEGTPLEQFVPAAEGAVDHFHAELHSDPDPTPSGPPPKEAQPVVVPEGPAQGSVDLDLAALDGDRRRRGD